MSDGFIGEAAGYADRGALTLQWAGQQWVADPSGALWWPMRKSLLLADVHFGKVGHFRKAGVPLPQSAFDKSLRKLDSIIRFYSPDNLIVIGDLFHSYYNIELEYFRAWRKRNSGVRIQLVQGNHDVLPPEMVQSLALENVGITYSVDNLDLVHDPTEGEGTPEEDQVGRFRLSGNIHPGVRMRGGGRQSLFLPCFWFGQKQALLPAFGIFTGLAAIHPQPGDQVLVIASSAGDEGRIIDISAGSSGI